MWLSITISEVDQPPTKRAKKNAFDLLMAAREKMYYPAANKGSDKLNQARRMLLNILKEHNAGFKQNELSAGSAFLDLLWKTLWQVRLLVHTIVSYYGGPIPNLPLCVAKILLLSMTDHTSIALHLGVSCLHITNFHITLYCNSILCWVSADLTARLQSYQAVTLLFYVRLYES